MAVGWVQPSRFMPTEISSRIASTESPVGPIVATTSVLLNRAIGDGAWSIGRMTSHRRRHHLADTAPPCVTSGAQTPTVLLHDVNPAEEEVPLGPLVELA